MRYPRIALALGLVTLLGLAAVGADDATGSLMSDVPTAVKLLGEGAYNLEVPFVNLTEYGNWYGPGYWGGGREKGEPGNKPPVDALDAIAMRHDFAYQIAEEQGKIHGAAEEQRLKAMADAIAVIQAKKLPEDPTDWDPPAPDPQKADRYRRRIGFGFTYLAGGRAAGSGALGVYEAIKKAIGGGEDTGDRISLEDLEKMVSDRQQNWFDTTDIRTTYRVVLSVPNSVIAQGESVMLDVSYDLVSRGSYTGDITEAPFKLDLDVDGPGSLAIYTIRPYAIGVALTAKSPWLWGTYNGSTINVEVWPTYLSDGDPGFDILPSSVDIIVATKTSMAMVVSPKQIDSWSTETSDPCKNVTLAAKFTTEEGKPLKEALVYFTGDNGVDGHAYTDSEGIARHHITICESDLDGADKKTFTFKATAPRQTVDDAVFFPASATASLPVAGTGTITVRGRVLDARHNDRPVSGATVTLVLNEETKTVSTGSDGRYNVAFPTPPIDQLPAVITGSVQKKGYAPKDFTTSERTSEVVRIDPLPATVTIKVFGIGENESNLVPNAVIRTTEPVVQRIDAPTGQTQIPGLYVGDRLSVSAGATNHKSYQKTGTIDLEAATISFYLPTGEGEFAGGDLNAEESEDGEDDAGRIDYALTIFASPADPEVGQGVTVTALVNPREAGIPIRLSVVGTDGYSNSKSTVTDASGRATLYIPGAASGVVDRVTVELLDQGRIRRLNYVF